jgi:hypothetical protein
VLLVILRSSCQAGLVADGGGGFLESLIQHLPAIIDTAAYRIFIESWESSWAILTVQAEHSWLFPALFGIVLVALVLTGARSMRKPLRPLVLFRILLAGLLAILAGYAPILASIHHLAVTQRTFLGTAIGSAIVSCVALSFVARISRPLMILAATCMISLGLGAQMFQRTYMRAYVDVLAPYLKEVSSRSDPAKRVHLVMDRSGLGGFLGGIYFTKLKYGVPLIRKAYGDRTTFARICRLIQRCHPANARSKASGGEVSSKEEGIKASIDACRCDRDFAAGWADKGIRRGVALSAKSSLLIAQIFPSIRLRRRLDVGLESFLPRRAGRTAGNTGLAFVDGRPSTRFRNRLPC